MPIIAISNRANDLLRKANEAKTPEMKGKYLKEYEKTCTKLKFSFVPGGAAVYDLFTKVPKWFAQEFLEIELLAEGANHIEVVKYKHNIKKVKRIRSRGKNYDE